MEFVVNISQNMYTYTSRCQYSPILYKCTENQSKKDPQTNGTNLHLLIIIPWQHIYINLFLSAHKTNTVKCIYGSGGGGSSSNGAQL